MQNPKVKQAFQDLMSGPGGPMGLMSNPAKLQEMMGNPEVRGLIEKIKPALEERLMLIYCWDDD